MTYQGEIQNPTPVMRFMTMMCDHAVGCDHGGWIISIEQRLTMGWVMTIWCIFTMG